MKKLTSLLLLCASGTVFAGADCQEYPESEWLSVFDMQKKIVNEYGFAIKKFKVDGDCYEIYGWKMDDSGKQQKIEVYFDTKTGAIVKQEID